MLGTSQLTLSWHPGWVRLPSYVTNCAVIGTSEDRDTAVSAVEVPGQQTMLGFGSVFHSFL